jgi:hypothetical protein
MMTTAKVRNVSVENEMMELLQQTSKLLMEGNPPEQKRSIFERKSYYFLSFYVEKRQIQVEIFSR